MVAPINELAPNLCSEVQGLERAPRSKLLGADIDGDSITEVNGAVRLGKQTDNEVGAASNAIGLSHVDVAIIGDEIRIGADLTSLRANTRRGDDVLENELLVTDDGKRLGIGKRVSNGDCALARVAVNGADETSRNVKLGGGLNGGGVVGDDFGGHFFKPFLLGSYLVAVVNEDIKRHRIVLGAMVDGLNRNAVVSELLSNPYVGTLYAVNVPEQVGLDVDELVVVIEANSRAMRDVNAPPDT